MGKKKFADGGLNTLPSTLTSPGGPVPTVGRPNMPSMPIRRGDMGRDRDDFRRPGMGSPGIMVGEPNPNRGRFGRRPGMSKGGSAKSASSRADGIAQKGKTKGKIY